MITLHDDNADGVTIYAHGKRVARLAPGEALQLQQVLNALYPPPPFEIAVGGRYRARSGHTYGPLIANPDSDYPFTIPYGGPSWTKQGHYLSERHVDTLDLIEPA
jgi:hypothetical protein